MQKANLINAVVQIILSFWIYYDAVNQGIHHLFPMALGIMMLSMNNGIMFNNKAQINVATFITIAVALFVAKMFWESTREGIQLEGILYAIMLFTSLFSLAMILRFKFVRKPK